MVRDVRSVDVGRSRASGVVPSARVVGSCDICSVRVCDLLWRGDAGQRSESWVGVTSTCHAFVEHRQ